MWLNAVGMQARMQEGQAAACVCVLVGVQQAPPPHTLTPPCLFLSPQALLLMDVHVHLSGCEVIGLLGGTWQPQQRLLRVTAAYPCR